MGQWMTLLLEKSEQIRGDDVELQRQKMAMNRVPTNKISSDTVYQITDKGRRSNRLPWYVGFS
jgi:hypothetical protein